MNTFILLYIILSILSFACVFTTKINAEKLYLTACFYMLILSVFRETNIGADTAVYCQAFHYIRSLSTIKQLWNMDWEFGFIFITRLVGLISINEHIYLGVLSFFILIPIFIIIKKYSKIPCLSLLIFLAFHYYYAANGLLRMWCAIAVSTCSFQYIIQRDFLKTCFFWILSIFFHRTIAPFIIIYFFYKTKINIESILLSLFVSIFLGVNGLNIVYFLNTYSRIHYNSFDRNGGVNMLLLYWGIFILVSIFKSEKNFDDSDNLFVRLLWIAAIIQSISLSFSNWSRVTTFFGISLIIVIPNLISYICIENSKNKSVFIAYYALIILILFFLFSINGIEEYSFFNINTFKAKNYI